MKRVAVPALVLFVLLAPAAQAARPATPEETTQIARDLKLEPGCVKATISEAAGRGILYGRVESADIEGCPTGDGFATVDNEATHPGFWLEGFSANQDDLPHCESQEVPNAVGRDLKICDPRPAQTWYPALNGLEIKPRRIHQGAHGLYRSIRWSSWTRTSARGRGIFDYADRDLQFKIPVRLRFYRVRFCDDGTRVFTRRKITAVRTRDRKRIRFDTVVRVAPGCPDDSER